MMLKPVNIADGRLDPDLLRHYDGELDYREAWGEPVMLLNGRRLVSASCWWDPAYGARAPGGGAGEGRAGGDASVIAAVFSDDDGGYWLHRIRYLTVDPEAALDEATQQCRQVAEFLRELHLPAVNLETNGLGRFLPGLLRRELARSGIAASVTEVASSRAKGARILEAFDARLAAGALHAHRSIWDTPLIREMREWRPDDRYKGHDDGLDAVAGCLNAEPIRVVTAGRPARRPDWRRGGTMGRAETDFNV